MSGLPGRKPFADFLRGAFGADTSNGKRETAPRRPKGPGQRYITNLLVGAKAQRFFDPTYGAPAGAQEEK